MEKVLCKNGYDTDGESIIKGCYYKVEKEDNNFYWVIVDGNCDTPYYLRCFRKNEKVGLEYLRFWNFFYTICELRKMKLNKLYRLEYGYDSIL